MMQMTTTVVTRGDKHAWKYLELKVYLEQKMDL